MGNLLCLLRKTNDSAKDAKVFVDFENALPTEDEKALYELIIPLIATSENLINDLKNYNGAEAVIKKTIDDPNDSTAKEAAWNHLVPLVKLMKNVYSFSLDLEKVFTDLLSKLCHDSHSLQVFEEKQALSLLFAKILDFILAFDAVKMSKPSLQNDFSYYRRTINRVTNYAETQSMIIEEVTPELANSILLFFANPTPFLNTISNCSMSHFKKLNTTNADAAIESFAVLAKLCKIMVETPSLSSRFQNPDTINFVLRVMTALIILYDHVHPIGSFSKTSNLDIKIYLRLIKEQRDDIKKPLMHTLMYTSKHFFDSKVPNSIKSQFSEQ